MKICNIYPVKNQQFYEKENFVMILAHLVKKGLYNPNSFNKNSYVIMDNGLFEGEQISTSLQDCIDTAESSGIKVDEIIIPDAVNDKTTTQNLFYQNRDIIDKYFDKYHFMYVAQAKDEDELLEQIRFINQFNEDYPNLTVGISKLCVFDRASDKALQAYSECLYPIHFLGIKNSFDELDKVKTKIRSCDSSQLAYMVKNNDALSNDIYTYRRRIDGTNIDLENDNLPNNVLEDLIKRFNNENNF